MSHRKTVNEPVLVFATPAPVFTRLIVTFERRSLFDDNEWLKETINLVHPDDPRTENVKKDGNASFRQLGDMFRGNDNYRNIVYTKVLAA